MQLLRMQKNKSGQQNKHIQQQVQLTTACVAQLVDAGFTVLVIQIENSKPAVWIEHSMKCSVLKGVMVMRRHGERGPEMVMAAVLEGCQVQWVVRGH